MSASTATTLSSATAPLKIKPLTARIGAEVSGVDLTRPLSADQVEAIEAALIAHQVIFFRNQPMDLAAHERFGGYFGALYDHVDVFGEDYIAKHAQPGHPGIVTIHADETSKGVAAEQWHTDMSCNAVPPMGTILHLHTLPPVGGDTLFASTTAAYDALSPRMKVYLEGLTATHDGGPAFSFFMGDRKFPKTEHPVVGVHPVTGKKLIFVNEEFTTRINGLPRGEGEALLKFLVAHCAKPDFQVRFRWEQDSVAFWDNRCTQHLAVWDYFPNTRSGFRVVIL